MTQEALKLALEFIENSECGTADLEAQIKEALAQTQEPWCMKMNGCKTKCEDCPDEPPQRTWVGLTDEDCKDMSAGDRVVAMWANRTLKEKNT